MNTPPRKSPLAIRTQLALLSLLVIILVGCHASLPAEGSDAISLMTTLDQRGRYDEAIRVAQAWMKKHPEDSAHNWAFYDQIAITYLMKASKDPGQREYWVHQAVDYYDKALLAHQKTDVDITLYETGRGFETAGDLSTTNRCLYYGRAVKAFEEEIPFIQGDSYTAYGKTIPLEPVRQQDEKALEAVKVKFAKAGCK
jgi:tetratricopeptide (TPR) repeat protein